MSLNQPQQELEYSIPLGMDKTSNEATIPEGFVREAWNADIGLSGGYDKRNGHTTQLDSAWTGRSILAGIEYTTPSIASRQVVYGTTGAAGAIGYVTGGGVTNIATGIDPTDRGYFVQFGNLLGYFNSTDAPLIYDGTTTRQMGITAPAAAPTLNTDAGGGSLVDGGSYVWAYTYYNSVTGAESSPSALFSRTVTSGSTRQVTLNVTAGSSTTADYIRVYRTVASGNQLFLDGTAAISATTYVSTVADSALTTALELDNSRVTSFLPASNVIQAHMPVVAANRIFLKTDRNVVRFSKIGQSGPMFESFQAQAAAFTQGVTGNADDIVALGAAGDVPIVVKGRSFGRLEAIGNPIQGATDPVLYTYVEMSGSVGGVSHGAGGPVLNEYVWLGKDNVYATDGRSFRRVADSMSAYIKGLGFQASKNSQLSFVNDTKNQRIIISVFSASGTTYPDTQLVGDYRRSDPEQPEKAFFRWTLYRPGLDSSTHPGIRPGCLFTTKSSTDGSVEVYAGNVELNGQLYKLNTGTNDRSSAIYFYVKSRAYSMKAPLQVKLFKNIGFHAYGNGNDYNMTVASTYDLSGSEEDSQTFSLIGTGDLWDTGVWDTAVWGDTATRLLTYTGHRKAKFLQASFTQSGLDQPASLLGWGATGSTYGLSNL